jgi:galactokinase
MREFFPAGEVRPLTLVSSPGRTELGGNHTDHNHGRVLAGAVHLDCLAAFTRSGNQVVTIHSHGFAKPIVVDLSDTQPHEKEQGTPQALVRGVAHAMKQFGYEIEGFDACVHSTVPLGTGLSSSAAFGVLMARIFNEMAGRSASTLELARAARRAENIHFGKPCGFMDQMTCAFMGIVGIDFADPDNPALQQVDFDLSGTGYTLAVVDTGGSHADLTPDYAAIREEMTGAAKVLGFEAARGIKWKQLLAHAADIRAELGDRAVLRLLHFIEEDRRATAMAALLRQGDMREYLRLVTASGQSSCDLLQNCYSPETPAKQPIPLALALTQRLLGERGGWRVQGGGFAGTIQVYVPEENFADYSEAMVRIFGPGCVLALRIRKPDEGLVVVENTEAKV